MDPLAGRALNLRSAGEGRRGGSARGLVPAPARLNGVETVLAGARPSDDVVAKAAAAAADDLGGDILGDVFASAEYRKAMAPVFVRRAIAAAIQRAS